jgi:hypothetical protein
MTMFFNCTTQPKEEESTLLMKIGSTCEVWVTDHAREYQRETGKVYLEREDLEYACESVEHTRVIVTREFIELYGKTQEDIHGPK